MGVVSLVWAVAASGGGVTQRACVNWGQLCSTWAVGAGLHFGSALIGVWCASLGGLENLAA